MGQGIRSCTWFGKGIGPIFWDVTTIRCIHMKPLMWPIGYCTIFFIQSNFVLVSSSRLTHQNPPISNGIVTTPWFHMFNSFCCSVLFQLQCDTLCEHAFSTLWLKNWIWMVVHGKSGTSWLEVLPCHVEFCSWKGDVKSWKAIDNFILNIASNLANFFHQANLSWSAL